MTASKTLKLKKRRKPIDVELILFIIFATLIPVVQWLIFYVYLNIEAFFMGFLNTDGQFTLENFKRLFDEFSKESSDIVIAIKNTLITFLIQVAWFIPSTMVSYFIYKQVPGASLYRILFFLPSVLYGICVSMCFQRMVGTTGFIAEWVGQWLGLDYVPELLADSRFANYTVWFNMLWFTFPGDLIIWGGTFARIPEELLESGKLDGVNWWTEFTKIIVPLLWPTVALKLVLLFCGIFGASANVFLLTGGAYETHTLSSWMYTSLLSGAVDSSSGIFNYLSAVGMVMTVLALAISLAIRKYTDKAFNDVDF